ncbi:MAG: hypothetical protein IJB96_07565, partial [Lachnospira sp.]|nr:hypothetical protein [Lachnospira sp.]
MELLEIVLLVGGVLCIVASFLIGEKEQDAASEGINARELTEQDKEYIRNQIDTLIEEQMGEVSEKTEAALDKISNTKIL